MKDFINRLVCNIIGHKRPEFYFLWWRCRRCGEHLEDYQDEDESQIEFRRWNT